ncbi:mucin-2 [Eurosta solidaginis]|uniref:mucin-2 n=1 Tax=Eurosta solidaginis TaxID=178769 RepID=UPI0035308BA7
MTRKIRLVHNVRLLSLLAVSILTLFPLSHSTQPRHRFPADYLVPPPLPTPQHLKHHSAPTNNPGIASVHQIPAASAPVPSHIANKNVAEPPGFMARIARWFGYGAIEQNQLANGFSSDSKQAYNYPQPLGADGKPCNLCNKYPWVPMFPQVLQQQRQHHKSVASTNHQYAQAGSQQHFEAQASQKYPQKQALPFGAGAKQQLPVKQRAVQFHFPTLYKPPPPPVDYNLSPLKATASPRFIPVPLPIPSLSLNALPPVYKAQQFRVPYLTPAAAPSTTTTSTESVPSGELQLPSTEPAHFIENIGAPSELQADRVRPEQSYSAKAPNSDSSFEIVKSHQITDFVSSVEYPITYEQSPSIDLGHQPTPINEAVANESVATALYQHETLSPELHKLLPASQLLTELGSFAAPQQQSHGTTQSQQATQSYQLQQGQYYQGTQFNSQQNAQSYQQTHTTFHPTFPQQIQPLYPQSLQEHQSLSQFAQTFETSTTRYTTPYVPQTKYPQHNYDVQRTTYESHSEDNFPSASSHNLTRVQHLSQNPNNTPWLPLGHAFPHTTTEIAIEYETSTQLPQLSETNFVTENLQETTQTPFIHSPQTPEQKQSLHDTRETPKRLLDSPIRYAPGSLNQPRPFTRDPSELNLRIRPAPYVTPEHPHNHKHNNFEGIGSSSTPLLVTPNPPLSPYNKGAAAAPTPTSTYSAIDASGQYAGMSPPTPPTPPPAQHKDVHQIIIPYTTRNKPRPFEPTRTVEAAFKKWTAQHNSNDIHEQQESKVVSAKLSTVAPPADSARRTTKYITRILATNLRDLLRREHDKRQNKTTTSSFDLLKWQRNIDNWTEQEYSSLSHRPSTPTIRGRSKHIPTEYLTTTTPSPRHPKTTIRLFEPSSELPASVNDLQALLLERGSQNVVLNQVDDVADKHLLDTLESKTVTVSSLPSRRTSTTQHQLNSNGHAAPTFMHLGSEIEQPEPEELWRKAKVSISPQTQEKVYVVTPQPRFFPQRAFSTTTSTEAPASFGKSPRFLVRPTHGNGTNLSASNQYNPELFGLMGLSSYVPAKPVEIIDGNSKVFNIGTTTPANNEDETTSRPLEYDEHLMMVKKRRLRSTMQPSPR